MAKSLRSKRKQKILGVRKKKVREQELKKMWAKHLLKQEGEKMQLGTLSEGGPIPSSTNDDEHSMEVSSTKISNSEMKKIEAKWGTRRSITKKLKAKRLRKNKGHAQW